MAQKDFTMRYTVKNSQAVHLWANRSQSHAKGTTVFFKRESVFSYGEHFEIGRHVTGTRGRAAVLINSRSYSPTTSKHQSWVRRATRHLTCFFVPLTSNNDPKAYFDYFVTQIRDTLITAGRARSNKEILLQCAKQYTMQANELAEFFGLRKRLTLPENFQQAIDNAKAETAKIERRTNAKLAKARRAAERQQEEYRKEAFLAVLDWQRGERASIPYLSLLPNVAYLRLSGETVQTSMGAEFPAEHGRRAYRILKALHARNQTFQSNGKTIPVGHFKIDQLDEQGTIRAGCHTVEWCEVERLANVAGWNAPQAQEPALQGIVVTEGTN